MKHSVLKLVLATAFAVASCGAFAGQDNTKSIAVSASVTNNCVVSAGSTLNFGAYDPVSANATTPAGDLPGTGSFQVRCTKSATGVQVGLGLGGNPSGTQRRLTNGANTLDYNMFQPETAGVPAPGGTCPGTTAWDDSGSKLAVGSAFWTDKNNKTIAVCGTIPGAQDVAGSLAGLSYTDTVTIDVTF